MGSLWIHKKKAYPVLSLILLLALSCGHGESDRDDDFDPSDHVPEPVSQAIGPAGGSLLTNWGDYNSTGIFIPAGALFHEIVFTISHGMVDCLPLDQCFGLVIDIEPDGTQFQVPATISLQYFENDYILAGLDEDEITLYQCEDVENPLTCEDITTGIDKINNIVYGAAESLSYFGMAFGEAPTTTTSSTTPTSSTTSTVWVTTTTLPPTTTTITQPPTTTTTTTLPTTTTTLGPTTTTTTSSTTTTTTVCPDSDGDGYYDDACGGDDCNDSNPDVNPGAVENCANGIDDDCDGLIDVDDPDCVVETEPNDDCDTVQELGSLVSGEPYVIAGSSDPVSDIFDFFGFVSGAGFITITLDCADDLDLWIGYCDEGVFYYIDASATYDCPEVIGGYFADTYHWEVLVTGDWAAAPSDYSLTIAWDACSDADGDSYLDEECGGDDCDDSDPTINPDAEEDCYDDIDNDCDGLVDEEDPECDFITTTTTVPTTTTTVPPTTTTTQPPTTTTTQPPTTTTTTLLLTTTTTTLPPTTTTITQPPTTTTLPTTTTTLPPTTTTTTTLPATTTTTTSTTTTTVPQYEYVSVTAVPRDEGGAPRTLGGIDVIIEWDENLAVVTDYVPTSGWVFNQTNPETWDTGEVKISAFRISGSPGDVHLGDIYFQKVGSGSTDLSYVLEVLNTTPDDGFDIITDYSWVELEPDSLAYLGK